VRCVCVSFRIIVCPAARFPAFTFGR
jgi:hypothetical protein